MIALEIEVRNFISGAWRGPSVEIYTDKKAVIERWPKESAGRF